MWANRIKRGFHRIGLVLAVICLLIGGISALFGAYLWIDPLFNGPSFEVSSAEGTVLRVRYGADPKEIGARVKERYTLESDRLKVVQMIDQEFGLVDSQRETGIHWMLGSLVSLIVAAALYEMARAVGWILAGFAGD